MFAIVPLGETLDLPCPDLCTLLPGHPWDGEAPDGHDLRSHAGSTFGEHVSTYATEHAGEPEALTYRVCLSDPADLNNMTVDQARDVGWSLMRAASWVAENRP